MKTATLFKLPLETYLDIVNSSEDRDEYVEGLEDAPVDIHGNLLIPPDFFEDHLLDLSIQLCKANKIDHLCFLQGLESINVPLEELGKVLGK